MIFDRESRTESYTVVHNCLISCLGRLPQLHPRSRRGGWKMAEGQCILAEAYYID